MKSKTLMFAVMSLLTLSANAQESNNEQETTLLNENKSLLNVNTTYMDHVYQGMGWDSNWFAEVYTGLNAFIGSPTGHGDLFDRTMPAFSFSVGKWITPTVGVRLRYQGFKFKDSDLDKNSFNNLHVDGMYNLSYLLFSDYQVEPKWNIIPYIGLGVLHNNKNGNKPFALSYGVNIGYRINDRLMAHAELGTTATWADFDGVGSAKKLSDNLAGLSIGLSYTIGKAGWHRVVDATPYMMKADYLESRIDKYIAQNEQLEAQHTEDQETLKQYRIILQLEQLLDKYGITPDSDEEFRRNLKNDYSGLNSLRRRLRQQNMLDNKDKYMPALWNPGDTMVMTSAEYINNIKSGAMFVGSPIFFFFKKGTTIITEKSQIINIKEIASAMKKYQLRARIVGAADKMTGTAKINEKLGDKRSKFLAKLLQKEGVKEEDIITEGRGGIDEYIPPMANRNACVLLYSK